MSKQHVFIPIFLSLGIFISFVCVSSVVAQNTKVPVIQTKAVFNSNAGISNTNKGCAEIKYGFEGGDIKKIGDTYHLIANERFADIPTVNNRFAYWQSSDGNHWERGSTLLQFAFDTTSVVPNSCIYSPKWVYSEDDNQWFLFYIQFKSNPLRKGGWYMRYDGELMLAKSQTMGMAGIAGPYNEGEMVFKRPEKAAWEGLQGITGFSPYKVGNKWYALYGSAKTEEQPCSKWQIGLATAESLDGEWTPVEKNEALVLPITAEAPEVFKFRGKYFAIVDEVSGNENFSLLVSENGTDWRYNSELVFLENEDWDWKEIRSPIGLVEENGAFYTWFTTYYKNTDFAPIRKMEFRFVLEE